jgi:hypothetical protein
MCVFGWVYLCVCVCACVCVCLCMCVCVCVCMYVCVCFVLQGSGTYKVAVSYKRGTPSAPNHQPLVGRHTSEDLMPRAWSVCAACSCPCISLSRATPLGRSRYQKSNSSTHRSSPTNYLPITGLDFRSV